MSLDMYCTIYHTVNNTLKPFLPPLYGTVQDSTERLRRTHRCLQVGGQLPEGD